MSLAASAAPPKPGDKATAGGGGGGGDATSGSAHLRRGMEELLQLHDVYELRALTVALKIDLPPDLQLPDRTLTHAESMAFFKKQGGRHHSYEIVSWGKAPEVETDYRAAAVKAAGEFGTPSSMASEPREKQGLIDILFATQCTHDGGYMKILSWMQEGIIDEYLNSKGIPFRWGTDPRRRTMTYWNSTSEEARRLRSRPGCTAR